VVCVVLSVDKHVRVVNHALLVLPPVLSTGLYCFLLFVVYTLFTRAPLERLRGRIRSPRVNPGLTGRVRVSVKVRVKG